MHCLGAVVPDRLGIHDTNGVCELVSSGDCSGVRWHEPREERIRFIGHDVLDWNTRLVEGGLHNRVVLFNCQ